MSSLSPVEADEAARQLFDFALRALGSGTHDSAPRPKT
jgi:hypothetical protein